MERKKLSVAIIGGGIGGLSAALLLLRAVDQTFIWALFDRRPMADWSIRRATLAVCLSRISPADVPDALREYERIRLPRASRVQGLAKANKTRLHVPDGPAQMARDAEMARGGTDFSPEAVGWLYGYDAEAPEVTPPE